MSRKKRRKQSPAGPEKKTADSPVSRTTTRPRPSRRGLLRGIAVAAAVIAIAAIAWLVLRARDGDVKLPPPVALEADAKVEPGDFAGAATCAECHAAQHTAWRGSTHGTAGGPPDTSTIIAPFNGEPISFKDAVVIPRSDDAGVYSFTVRRNGEPDLVFRVDGVVGRGHLVGGGTQGFVSRYPDGTVRFLPFDFIRDEGVWFCNTAGRSAKGWVPITPELRLAECGDWPPVRVLGSHERFPNCQECHGSQIRLAYDEQDRQYETSFASLQINCESCHGPAKEHVEVARAGRIGRDGVALPSLQTLTKEASVELCLRCHGLKDMLQPGYLPGDRLEDYYSLLLPVFARPYTPDGRVRSFVYQETHLSSDCYLSGSMTCVDCHEPHAQGYRDQNRVALSDRFSNGQCLGCHPSKQDVTRHTFHAPSSAGSRCVSCHMPYLQQPQLGAKLRYARSDHAIPVPRPAFDDSIGIRTACLHCHEGSSTRTLAAQARSWWGQLKPPRPLVQELVDAPSSSNHLETTRRLLQPDATHPVAQAMALAFILPRVLRPDMNDLDPEVEERLRAFTRAANLDHRAMALAALHLARGTDRDTRKLLARTLKEAGRNDFALRRRWVLTLSSLAEGFRARRDPGSAAVAYLRALEVQPEDASTLADLAQTYAEIGDHRRAIEHFTASLDAGPPQAVVMLQMSLSQIQLGDIDGAMATANRAVEALPADALSHLALGNVHYRRGSAAAAVGAYERAVALDPSLLPAQNYLARAYLLAGRRADALRVARQALEFAPQDPMATQLIGEIGRAPQDP